MDLMTRCGGRKFLIAIAAIGAAMYLELVGKGLSPTMAGFLVSIVGVFHAANYASSKTYLQNKKAGNDPGLQDQMGELHTTLKEGFAPEKTEALKNLLTSINSGVSQSQVLSGQTAQALLNLTQVLNNLNQRK